MNINLQLLVTHVWERLQEAPKEGNHYMVLSGDIHTYMRDYCNVTATAITGRTQLSTSAVFNNETAINTLSLTSFTAKKLIGKRCDSILLDSNAMTLPSARSALIALWPLFRECTTKFYVLHADSGFIAGAKPENIAKELGVDYGPVA